MFSEWAVRRTKTDGPQLTCQEKLMDLISPINIVTKKKNQKKQNKTKTGPEALVEKNSNKDVSIP